MKGAEGKGREIEGGGEEKGERLKGAEGKRERD